jgi:hypothetical protein
MQLEISSEARNTLTESLLLAAEILRSDHGTNVFVSFVKDIISPDKDCNRDVIIEKINDVIENYTPTLILTLNMPTSHHGIHHRNDMHKPFIYLSPKVFDFNYLGGVAPLFGAVVILHEFAHYLVSHLSTSTSLEKMTCLNRKDAGFYVESLLFGGKVGLCEDTQHKVHVIVNLKGVDHVIREERCIALHRGKFHIF